MLKFKVVHEDVLIKLFRYSLDGATQDWCRSLSVACISSLSHFHASFNLFCKEKIPVDFLYQECCHEFDLLIKGSDIHMEYTVVEDTFHNDREVNDLQSDNHILDTFENVSNVSIVLNCPEDQMVSFEYSNGNENIDISSCYSCGSATHIKKPMINIEISEGNSQQL
jgi:hypothetical protein